MGLLPFAPNDFKVSFTLFPKCFSSFVHTTCSLSVLVRCLAFAEVHLRFCTALSNCATLGVLLGWISPWAYRPFQDLAIHQVTGQSPSLVTLSIVLHLTPWRLSHWPLHYNSTASGSFGCRFKHRLIPVHSPLLRESRLLSCPPLNDMLKFSGYSCIAEVVCGLCVCCLWEREILSCSVSRVNARDTLKREFKWTLEQRERETPKRKTLSLSLANPLKTSHIFNARQVSNVTEIAFELPRQREQIVSINA